MSVVQALVTVLDTPDPKGLAEFYRSLLGGEVVQGGPDWVTLHPSVGSELAFQLAPELVPPSWPDPGVPQQFHLDLRVPDLDAAERDVLALGGRATGLPGGDATFRVYLDPSGHPFCLCAC